jgi:pyruvate dehydrogenase E2 component (dihydrolipoamide acetyltransferase)
VLVTFDTGDGAQAPQPAAPVEKPAPVQPKRTAGESPAPQAAKALATPAIRKMAQDLGIDINQVSGTGPGGRVTKQDLEKFTAKAEMPTAEKQPAARIPEKAEEIPLRGLRKKIAEKMVQSKRTIPHYTYVDEIDMTELVKLRQSAKEMSSDKGVKLTYLPFIMKGLIEGLKKYPLLNSSLDEDHGKIFLKRQYNLGVGVATPDGLTVVVVKDADKKSILELAQDLERLSEQARQNKIALEDLKGSTFTITSLGTLGGMFATPIINHPEVAIVGIHKIEPRPVVRDGQIVARDMMYMSLSFDHRVVDGAVGAEFCAYVKRFLENPALLFMKL